MYTGRYIASPNPQGGHACVPGKKNLFKTIEICRINLRAYDKDEYYDLDRQALDQLELMLFSAHGLIQTIYDLLKH